MPRRLDHDQLSRDLQRLLAVEGPTTAASLCRSLRISQQAFSRLARREKSDLLVVGRARATRYAGRRVVPDVGSTLPLYEIDESGKARRSAQLHATAHGGFYVESAVEGIESRFHSDLPFFLNELRPAGYLGRRIPRRHPELQLPADITLWSSDHCLRYLARYGWDAPGSFVLGDRALELYLSHLANPQGRVDSRERALAYPRLAEDALAARPAGSSAAGEQPKFLVTLEAEAKPVLVKFSPPRGEAVAQRAADLLVCEHLAHQVLRRHGHATCRSELLVAGERVFLEVERFDRTAAGGRRAVLSLSAIDSEFVGDLRDWTRSARALHEQGRIGAETLAQISWLELFGHLIANTDMHLGNLAFFMEGERILELTPTYDMLPMFHAAQQGNLPAATHELPTPSPLHAQAWRTAEPAARALWEAVAGHDLISGGFRQIARESLERLDRWKRIAEKLPSS